MLKYRVHLLLHLHHAVNFFHLARLVLVGDLGHVKMKGVGRAARGDVGALHDLVRRDTLDQLRGRRNIQNLRWLNDLLDALLLIFAGRDFPEKAF